MSKSVSLFPLRIWELLPTPECYDKKKKCHFRSELHNSPAYIPSLFKVTSAIKTVAFIESSLCPLKTVQNSITVIVHLDLHSEMF